MRKKTEPLETDRLIVEIVTNVDNLTFPNYSEPTSPITLAKTGEKYTKNITGKEYYEIRKSIEDDIPTLTQAKKQYTAALKREVNKQLAVFRTEDEKSPDVQAQITAWKFVNSYSRKFFEMTGRGILPVRSISIMANNGAAKDDHEANNADLMQLMREKLRLELKIDREKTAASAK